MTTDSSYCGSALLPLLVAEVEIRELLNTEMIVPDLAHAVKDFAFKQVPYDRTRDRYYMLALLDTVDWPALANSLQQRLSNKYNSGASRELVSLKRCSSQTPPPPRLHRP